ncbi:MAG: hypothetical protein NC548_28580 [Lachnospiraceae bacterium]|nr:hypothetical protein [Lachnospiraceae bacterium]
MLRMWLEHGYVTDDTLRNVATLWTLSPTKADYACAVRISKLAKLTENETASEIREDVKQMLSEHVQYANTMYNQKSNASAALFVDLCLFMSYADAYTMVSGINGDKQIVLTVEDDISGRLFVDADLVSRE